MNKRFNYFSNIVFCLKLLFSYKKITILFFIFEILFSLLEPLVATIITTMVVYALTNGVNIPQYLLLITILVIINLFVSIIRLFSQEKYSWNACFSRCSDTWNNLCEKAISTDYMNVEPRKNMEAFQKGFESISSNWKGIEGLTRIIPDIIFNFIGMIMYAIIVAIYSPYILLVFLGMILSNFLLVMWSINYIKRNRNEQNKLYHRSNVLSNMTVSNEYAKDVRAYHLNNLLNRAFDILSKKTFDFDKHYFFRYFFSGVSDCLFLFIRDLVAYSTLLALLINGQIGITMFTFLISLTIGFSSFVNLFSKYFNEGRLASVEVSDYRNSLNVKDTLNHGKGLDIKSIKKPIEIIFDHVYFSYPDSKEPIIKDLSFIIHPGEKIALVGNNGAGKTTIIKLLCGLYLPNSGDIYISGHKISEFNIDDYMSLISAVFQDVNPLAFTILDNVTCADKTKIDINKFWLSLERAGLKEKVLSLENKENTYITQRFSLEGIRLSGGETQKLLLARALYKDGDLLLDEPTSALDPLSEEAMYKQYFQYSKTKTSIFISHRLASTKFCNRIFFISNGQIVEEGSHEELIKKDGPYREMFDIQSKYYKEDSHDEHKEIIAF